MPRLITAAMAQHRPGSLFFPLICTGPSSSANTYHALVTLTVTGPQGGIASVSGVPDQPVTITGTGGTFTIDQTGNDGKTLDATVTWTCP